MTVPYPPARYEGDGEVSARIRRADAPADLQLGETSVHYLSTGDSTDGLFGLYRWEMPAGPGGAAPHFHRSFSESFYVLTGSVRIHDGERWIDAGPGDYAHVPPGGIHGFANESGEPASLLILFAPGAPREAYFEGLPSLATMDDDQRGEFLRRHDNLYVPQSRDNGVSPSE